MDIRKLQRAIVDGLEDVKAQDILVFNTEHLSPLFERVIIASGTSNRQTKALAASVRDAVRATGERVLATEGEDNGEWIIVDCGAAVAHIMQPAIREYYRLEEIWGGKAVKLKLGANARSGLVKAEEPEPVPVKTGRKTAAGKTAASKTTAGKVHSREDKAAAKTAAMAPTGKAPARKAVARAGSGSGAGAAMRSDRLAAAKKSAATAPRKTAGRAKTTEPRGPVSQTLVVKPPARKTAAKAEAPGAGRAAVKPAGRAPAKKAAGRAPIKTAGRAPAKPASRAPAGPAVRAPAKKAAAKSAVKATAARKSAPRRG